MSTGVPVAFRRAANEKVNVRSSIPFALVHLTPLAIIWTGIGWSDVVLCLVLYEVRMFFITAGYHRYFAHNSYRLNRFWQLVMAFGGTTAAQQGPLWWASLHRDHHRWSDTPQDIHSPLKGFWWSHVGWILCDKYSETRYDRITDFAAYPELRWLNRHDWIGPWVLGIATTLLFGWRGLFVGFFLSTILLWHATFLVNSLAHVFGRRRYATHDSSRNSALIALLTNGEGWHNNHHYLQTSARQGFFWWEPDLTYYVLLLLRALGVVHDLKMPARGLLDRNRVRDGFDIGMFEIYLARAGGILTAARSQVNEAYDHAREGVTATMTSTVAAAELLARQSRSQPA